MFVRVEVGVKPQYSDPKADRLLRRLELAHPEIRERLSWARMLDIFWLELPDGAITPSALTEAVQEIFGDSVLLFMNTEKSQELDHLRALGADQILALEKHYRPGVTDNVGRTAREALEIVLSENLENARCGSGSLLLFGAGEEIGTPEISSIAKDVFSNELIETWKEKSWASLQDGSRFKEEEIQKDFPPVSIQEINEIEEVNLQGLTDSELEKLSLNRLWALTLEEMKAIRAHFETLGRNPTDAEVEVLAQTWSEHCKHKIFAAEIGYEGNGDHDIPAKIDSLFKTTIAGTTSQLERDWLLSVFSDNAGIVAFDEDSAFCIKVETHNSPSALDPYGGALTGIVGVNRDILGCGLGARPVFNTNVFCTAAPDYSKPLPDRIMHPRRILEGIRHGVEDGGNKSGIPTVNGALVFDERYLGKPLVYCGTGGFMPRKAAGRPIEEKKVLPGDRICMVGGRIGKDGIHGATFSSLALDENSPVTAVQLGDPITQKRMADFLLEARDLGLYRAITDNGAGGLSSSVGEMAELSGGARMDVALAKTKYPGLRPYELVVSESQERMTVAVAPEKMPEFLKLAKRRAVEVSDLGEFTDSGFFEVLYRERPMVKLSLDFLHDGVPKLRLKARWSGRAANPPSKKEEFGTRAGQLLVELLGRPNIASKEWLIRQYDHEVQGTSVIKPLHTVNLQESGPNDGGVIKPKPDSEKGIAVACGINPKLSDIDPYLMAQSAVDESVRNLLCMGAEFGAPDSVLALVDNFCWPDPVSDEEKAAALVRACFGMKEAALALQAPFVSGKDSMKNDFRGKIQGKDVKISVPPTLLVTAVGRVIDVKNARTSDFKEAGDSVYLVGPADFGLVGSELHSLVKEKGEEHLPASLDQGESKVGEPDWDIARKVYPWLGRSKGKQQDLIRSIHDVSDGGLLTAVAEGILARGLGVELQSPEKIQQQDLWSFWFGEGFHAFVVSARSENAPALERDWQDSGVPFLKIGRVNTSGELRAEGFSVSVKQLRAAWKKEGYWQ